ncbi:MAG: hypothetical protein AAFV47_08945 [Pseudomonadota bacterium]
MSSKRYPEEFKTEALLPVPTREENSPAVSSKNEAASETRC